MSIVQSSTQAATDMYRLLLVLWWTILDIHLLCFMVDGRYYGNSQNVYIPSDDVKVHGKTILTLFTTALTWNEASVACKMMFPGQAGMLAKPDNMEAVSVVRDLLKGSTYGAWIGLYWSGHGNNRKLAWSDLSCTNFDSQSFGQFETSHDKDSESNACYYVNATNEAWMKDPCNSKHFFLCEHQNFADVSCFQRKKIFTRVNSAFYVVDKSGANQQTCTSECLKTTGCFLTWPINHACLMGVVEEKGSVWVKIRCYEGDNSTQMALQVTSDNSVDPVDCQQTDTSGISTNTTRISGRALLVDAVDVCSDYTTSLTTITASSIICPVITKTFTATTTDFITTTTTIFAAGTFINSSALSATASVSLEDSYAPTMTSCWISPSTVTKTVYAPVEFILDTTPSNIDYTILPSSQCLDTATVTIVTTNNQWILSHCACATLQTGTSTKDEIKRWTSCLEATVTETITNIIFAEHITAQPRIVASTSAGIVRTSTTTVIREDISTVFDIVTDCLQIEATTTTEMLQTDVAVSGQMMLSASLVNLMVTNTYLDHDNSQLISQLIGINQSNDSSSFVYPLTSSRQNIADQTSSIINELLLRGSDLSSCRRRKESAPDNRTSARVSGFVACIFCSCLVLLVVLLDMPIVFRFVKVRFESLRK